MDTKLFYAEISQRYYSETFGQPQTFRSFNRAIRTEAVLAMLDKHVARGSVVGDFGCGPAQYASPVLEKGYEYIGLDLAPEMFQATSAQLAGNPRAKFLTGTIEYLPLADASVDAALAVGVFEYLASDEGALREMARVLKPGGIAIITFPNLLNPVHALRSVARPVVAPICRKVGWRTDTVFVSGIVYRTFIPQAFQRKSMAAGFQLVDEHCHGFKFQLMDSPVSAERVNEFIEHDARKRKWLRQFGMNVIFCFRKC